MKSVLEWDRMRFAPVVVAVVGSSELGVYDVVVATVGVSFIRRDGLLLFTESSSSSMVYPFS